MKNSLMKIWAFSKKRHQSVVTALIFSFLRSIFGITEILSILYTVEVLTGYLLVKTGVIRIAILTAVCIVGNFVTSYFEQANTMKTGFYMVGDKRVSVGNLLRRVPLGFFTGSSVGKITATLTTTLSGVESAAVMTVVGIVSGLFSSFSLFVFMLFYDYRIGILTGVGMVCYLLIVSLQIRISEKNAPTLQKAQTTLADQALTFLQGIKVTKAFSFKAGDKNLKKAIQGSRDANITLTSKSMPSQFAAGLTIAFFESLILFASLLFHFTLQDISVIKTIVLLIFSFMVYASLNQAGSMLSMIGLLDSGLQEVETLEKTKTLEVTSPMQTATSDTVCFDHVSFSYGDTEILHDITATMPEKSFTAVVGPSGSGKTTLCELIPRFHDVKKGSITVGGVDIRHMAYEDLMKKISMVFQDVYVFEDTVFNNIRFGKPDATREEVEKVAKAARCHDFIMKLPNGYDTMVEENGSNLSGGEKQRISIARAMLKDAPIIILDEATSALDAENESEILSAMDELTKNKTVIMIAHRIKTVEKADTILVIEKGRVVQKGTHRELKNQEGLYATFLQARESAGGWRL